jgi:hypothetical protein
MRAEGRGFKEMEDLPTAWERSVLCSPGAYLQTHESVYPPLQIAAHRGFGQPTWREEESL